MNLRPEANEYSAYFARYIGLVPEGNLLELLERQAAETSRLFLEVPEEKGGFRYAPGKWSLKEVLGHIADTERVMGCRALRIARGDRTAFPGFDQDLFVAGANFDARTLNSLLEEYNAVRKATVALLAGLPREAWLRRGTVSNGEMTVRALGCVIAGHELHHVSVIKSRYLQE